MNLTLAIDSNINKSINSVILNKNKSNIQVLNEKIGKFKKDNERIGTYKDIIKKNNRKL